MARRNPSSSSMIPLLVLGIGAVALYAAHNKGAPVNGMGDVGSLFSKAKKAVKKQANKIASVPKGIVSKIPLVNKLAAATAGAVKSINVADVAKYAAGGGIIATGLMAKKLVQQVTKGKRQPKKVPTQPGQTVEYQDENGNVITEAEYNRRQALYEAQATCVAQGRTWNGTACIQSPSAAGQSFTEPAPAAAYNLPSGGSSGSGQSYSDSSYGGGGGGGSDATILPPAESTPEPSTADESAPAPAPTGKLNPLVAVATFAAVPLLLGLTGGK